MRFQLSFLFHFCSCNVSFELVDEISAEFLISFIDKKKNKNQASKVNAARKAVEKWQHEGRAAVVVDPTAETESGVDDPCSLTQSKLQHLAMVR